MYLGVEKGVRKMSGIKCPHCGGDVSEPGGACPQCGRPVGGKVYTCLRCGRTASTLNCLAEGLVCNDCLKPEERPDQAAKARRGFGWIGATAMLLFIILLLVSKHGGGSGITKDEMVRQLNEMNQAYGGFFILITEDELINLFGPPSRKSTSESNVVFVYRLRGGTVVLSGRYVPGYGRGAVWIESLSY